MKIVKALVTHLCLQTVAHACLGYTARLFRPYGEIVSTIVTIVFNKMDAKTLAKAFQLHRISLDASKLKFRQGSRT